MKVSFVNYTERSTKCPLKVLTTPVKAKYLRKANQKSNNPPPKIYNRKQKKD